MFRRYILTFNANTNFKNITKLTGTIFLIIYMYIYVLYELRLNDYFKPGQLLSNRNTYAEKHIRIYTK